MFNSYRVTPKVDARSTNNYSFDFNAVSGTLCRSHPKSMFIWFQQGSKYDEMVMGANPCFTFSHKKESWHDEDGNWHYEEIKPDPIVVLQIMLTGDNRVIAEIVKEDDFEVSVDE